MMCENQTSFPGLLRQTLRLLAFSFALDEKTSATDLELVSCVNTLLKRKLRMRIDFAHQSKYNTSSSSFIHSCYLCRTDFLR